MCQRTHAAPTPDGKRRDMKDMKDSPMFSASDSNRQLVCCHTARLPGSDAVLGLAPLRRAADRRCLFRPTLRQYGAVRRPDLS